MSDDDYTQLRRYAISLLVMAERGLNTPERESVYLSRDRRRELAELRDEVKRLRDELARRGIVLGK